MLQYLVTSKVRRRLLVLLWAERKTGSVAELAELADVSFASAHAELKAMQRLQLVHSERGSGKEVFAANEEHPDADLVAKLAASDTPHRPMKADNDHRLKRQLVALGAPLRGVEPLAVATTELPEVLVQATELARRDAVVARTLPLCFWRSRERLDAKVLQGLDATPEEKHAFAFFLELAGELGRDRRLVGLAEGLRDKRLTQLRPFFHAASSISREFPLAAKWGFVMNTDRDSFRALFDKFAGR